MDGLDRKPGAVILGGSFHSLGAARNLAKFGVHVCALDTGSCVSRFSRAVGRFINSPSADDEPEFVEFLSKIAENEHMNGWVLFASTDEYVRILAQNREFLSEHYNFTIPSWDVVQFLYDKRLTYRLAEEMKVHIPTTYTPQSLEEIKSLSLDYPVVLKPAISKRFMAATKKKAFRANNQEELIDFYQTMAEIIDPSDVIVQELIPGKTENLYSFVGFFKDGISIAGLSARRLRQHPMEFGRASTYVVTADIPELEILANQFLKGISFSGLAEVEFMYAQKDGCFKLLEVNPRIWGWHTITINAGLDLPYLAYSDAIGMDIVKVSVIKDMKWVRLVTDIPTVIQEISSGRLTLRQYLASMSGDITFAVLSFNDPLPFIMDLFLAPYNYFIGRGF